jgi:hypothetical protein
MLPSTTTAAPVIASHSLCAMLLARLLARLAEACAFALAFCMSAARLCYCFGCCWYACLLLLVAGLAWHNSCQMTGEGGGISEGGGCLVVACCACVVVLSQERQGSAGAPDPALAAFCSMPPPPLLLHESASHAHLDPIRGRHLHRHGAAAIASNPSNYVVKLFCSVRSPAGAPTAPVLCAAAPAVLRLLRSANCFRCLYQYVIKYFN